jgi:predicted transcriptional regulator
MKVLTIKIEELKKVAKYLLKQTTKAQTCGELKEENKLVFTSVEELFQTLTPARWKVIIALQNRSFNSIKELADFLQRDYSNVWNDLQILKDLGIAEIENQGRGYKVYIPYKKIVLEFPKNVENLQVPEV